VLVQEDNASPSVITIECCSLLVESTSEEIADHIRASWITGTYRQLPLQLLLDLTTISDLGQHCIDLLREELGPDLADVLSPITLGGVQLHKLQGAMHDTCNTANKTARLAKSLRDTSGQLFFG
jgi:hypothetical protein